MALAIVRVRSAGAAGAGESQSREGRADERHHHGDDGPGDSVARANTTISSGHDERTPRTRPIGACTRATMAPRRPPLPIRQAERARASPPMTAGLSPVTAAVLAAIRSGGTV